MKEKCWDEIIEVGAFPKGRENEDILIAFYLATAVSANAWWN